MGALRRPRGRVLVVDDDPVICDLLATALAEHGYLTRRASDAREALYLIQRETPDVVLLDVHSRAQAVALAFQERPDETPDRVGPIPFPGGRVAGLSE